MSAFVNAPLNQLSCGMHSAYGMDMKTNFVHSTLLLLSAVRIENCTKFICSKQFTHFAQLAGLYVKIGKMKLMPNAKFYMNVDIFR